MTSKALDYVCIFTGGSIRGAAYVGALRAMEELGLNNKCFVGSSVGAVIASFYAVGCTPDELEEITNNINFELFKDINFTISKSFSISKGEFFLDWLREIIEKNFYGDKYEKGQNAPVTFRDLKKDVVIISTDLNTTEVKVFSRKTTPDFEVATAVRISSSWPGLLKPLVQDGHTLVDGDLSRSWPIWKMIPNLLEYDARILEFRLEGGKNHYNFDNSLDYFDSVYTAYSNFAADHVIDAYKTRDKFDYIRLDTQDTNLIDFNLPKEKKQKLYEIGYNTTKDFFKRELPQKRAVILPYYKKMYKEISEIKENIEKSKYILAKNKLAELFVYISKARKLIDLAFYDEILEFYDLYKTNLFMALGLVSVLKNRTETIKAIAKIETELKEKSEELDGFINTAR